MGDDFIPVRAPLAPAKSVRLHCFFRLSPCVRGRIRAGPRTCQDPSPFAGKRGARRLPDRGPCLVDGAPRDAVSGDGARLMPGVYSHRALNLRWWDGIHRHGRRCGADGNRRCRGDRQPSQPDPGRLHQRRQRRQRGRHLGHDAAHRDERDSRTEATADEEDEAARQLAGVGQPASRWALAARAPRVSASARDHSAPVAAAVTRLTRRLWGSTRRLMRLRPASLVRAAHNVLRAVNETGVGPGWSAGGLSDSPRATVVDVAFRICGERAGDASPPVALKCFYGMILGN